MTTSRTRTDAGFTLIELMLSIGLGILLLYTAFAAFRTAAQAVTIANRLSLENSCLRAGYFQVENDLDFWTSQDDPDNSNNQLLRGTGTTANLGAGGLPFTPMNAVYSLLGISPTPPKFLNGAGLQGDIQPRPGSPTTTPYPYPDPNWENDRGFDFSYSWTPSDPRTWFRGQMAAKSGGQIQPMPENGRYAMYQNTSSTPSFGSITGNYMPTALNWMTPFTLIPSFSGGTTPQLFTSTYTGNANSTWYPNQVMMFLNAMGYEALCEYLPTNAVYDYYTNYNSNTTTTDGEALICITPGWFGGGNSFGNGDGGQVTARGIYRNTYSTSYSYQNPNAPPDGSVPVNGIMPQEPGIINRAYMHWDSDYTAVGGTFGGGWNQGGSPGLQDMLAHALYEQGLMASEPIYWPVVSTCVGRFVKCGHFVACAKIRRILPLTGEVVELSFLGLGSTLRGARMQRIRPDMVGPNGAWAKWDDTPGFTDPVTFDTYP